MKKWQAIGLFFLMLIPIRIGAQDFTWWNQLHMWDGHTNWIEYLTISPAFLGPNALPVPVVLTGQLPRTGITGRYQYFARQEDRTHAGHFQACIPLFSDRVSLQLGGTFLEYYNSSISARDRRKSRDFDGMGVSVGDLSFGTLIALVEHHERLPDIVLSVNFRTASGSNLEAARFSDAPGYHFDLSLGKDFVINRQRAA
ncbi:MAG: hypothetical protein KTR24_03500, partial [Saprospiraceae bacterium]|nr:hypothetical protein [Saprospiraceae bacterium]